MAGVTIDPHRFAVLMGLVGRSVARYQRIERALKLLLPHLAEQGAARTEGVPNWREFLDSKHTLGPLMEQFKGRLRSDRPEDVHSYLESVVEERNDLVHHFFSRSRALTGSSDALEHAISEVRRRLENALPLEQALLAVVGEFVRELEQSLDFDDDVEAPRSL